MTSETASKVKSFPWRCPRCLEQAVQPATILYTAKRMCDGQLQTLEISDLCIPQCQKCGELVFTNSVHEQIQEAFRAQQQVGAQAK
jgi:formylmethanofuran dehydrogenase subunit E